MLTRGVGVDSSCQRDMEAVQLFFRASRSADDEAVLDRVNGYLASLFQNGQIIGGTLVARVNGGYLATARRPEREALAHRFNNKWVRSRPRELTAVGLAIPEVTLLGREPDRLAPCACRRRPFLVLFTTFLSDESPVRCGACFGPVALYRVRASIETGNNQDVLWWQDTYQAMDWLYVGSGAGEQAALNQLSRVDSQLSTEGRELARDVEARVGVPVYYYLSKHVGRSDVAERKRRCPSCLKAWLLDEPLHRIFDFRCDRCRLLSNVAFDVRVPSLTRLAAQKESASASAPSSRRRTIVPSRPRRSRRR
jgi:predicted  nucleic acid-binding Zn ribbon protein